MPADVAVLEEIRDLLEAAGRPTPPTGCLTSAVVRRHLRAQPARPRRASARATVVRSSGVDSGSTSPKTSASRRLRSASSPRLLVMRTVRPRAPLRPPRCRSAVRRSPASASSAPVAEPDGDAPPVGLGRTSVRLATASRRCSALITSLEGFGASGSSFLIALPDVVGRGQPPDPVGVVGGVVGRDGEELDLVQPDVLELDAELAELRQVAQALVDGATWWRRRGTRRA